MDKSVFNFKIQKKDGSIIDLHEKNLWVSSFHIPSPAPDHITEKVYGRHGSILMGNTLKERKVTSRIMFEAVDPIDFDLFRDEIFQIFNPLETIHIIRDLQPGKRIEVSVTGDFDIDYLTLEDGEFSIDFVIHSVFFESIGTTLTPFTFDAEVWQVGQGLVDEDMIYIHSTNQFKIYNAGDIVINPRIVPLKITYNGPSSNLKIKNLTNNDEWQYTGTTSEGHTIELNGIRSFRNGSSIFKDTNRKLITLEKGWNEFEITGTSGSFQIIFDFRFYYL